MDLDGINDLLMVARPRALADAARRLGLEWDESAEAWTDDVWHADDGNCEVEYPHASSGREAAQDYVDDCDWGEPCRATIWIQVWAWRVGYQIDSRGDAVCVDLDREDYQIAIDPDEPECSDDDDHDWKSPIGVYGHGGGVVVTEVCSHCGTYRSTDTWAQGPGGVQGLTSVGYLDADEEEEDWEEDWEDEEEEDWEEDWEEEEEEYGDDA